MTAPTWHVPKGPDGEPLLADSVVRALFEVSTSAVDMQDRIDRAVRRIGRPAPEGCYDSHEPYPMPG